MVSEGVTDILGVDFSESAEVVCDSNNAAASPLFILIYASHAPEIPDQAGRAERQGGSALALSLYLSDVENVLRVNGVTEYHYVNFFEGLSTTGRLSICAYARAGDSFELYHKLKEELPKGQDGENVFDVFVTNRNAETASPDGGVSSTVHLKMQEMMSQRMSGNIIATVSLKFKSLSQDCQK